MFRSPFQDILARSPLTDGHAASEETPVESALQDERTNNAFPVNPVLAYSSRLRRNADHPDLSFLS
jgi:hypothetical protein